MGNRVIHFEITGSNGPALNKFYGDLFDWSINTDNPMNYGTIAPQGENAIGGGIGQTPDGGQGWVTFYVETDDVGAYLKKAESLGGSILMGPDDVMEGLTIGLFTDPEGHVVGLTNPQQA